MCNDRDVVKRYYVVARHTKCPAELPFGTLSHVGVFEREADARTRIGEFTNDNTYSQFIIFEDTGTSIGQVSSAKRVPAMLQWGL